LIPSLKSLGPPLEMVLAYYLVYCNSLPASYYV